MATFSPSRVQSVLLAEIKVQWPFLITPRKAPRSWTLYVCREPLALQSFFRSAPRLSSAHLFPMCSGSLFPLLLFCSSWSHLSSPGLLPRRASLCCSCPNTSQEDTHSVSRTRWARSAPDHTVLELTLPGIPRNSARPPAFWLPSGRAPSELVTKPKPDGIGKECCTRLGGRGCDL